MPYSNVPDDKQDEMERCVAKVEESGKDKEAAIRICYASIVEGKADAIAAVKAAGFILDETKIGRRNSGRDQERLQAIHDFAVENGAECKTEEREYMAVSGHEIKALGDGKVGGYLVRWGDPNTPDLTGDYFTADTYFGDASTVDVYYHHGLDKKMGRRVLGKATLRKDEAGIWAEAQLAMRDEYEQKIYELATAGKLGWSSGTAAHLMEREPSGKANRLTRWPLVEASLTPTPAEPRNAVTPLKSLIPAEAADAAPSEEIAPTLPQEATMTDINVEEIVQKAAAAAAAEAIKTMQAANQPATSAGFVSVTEDEADRALKGNPFATGGEFLMAVKLAELAPHAIDKRLLPLKATGLNEAIPSQGGFLVPEQFAAGIRDSMYSAGSILSRMNVIPVVGNSMTFNAIDETSRVDGSRKGGIRGYWMAEGGTKTASKPAFRQIELKLKKVAALCYATDELLEDAGALQGWLETNVPDELRFKVEDAIINGDGVGKPLGIMSSPALVVPLRTDGNEIDVADVARVWQARHRGYNDYIWLTGDNTFVQLLQMSVSNQPVYMPPGGVSGAPYGTLFGRPVIESEYAAALGSLGDLILFAPSAILAIQKAGGVQSASSIHVQFTTDETAFRFVYRFDSSPEFVSAITQFKSATTNSPYVALKASSN